MRIAIPYEAGQVFQHFGKTQTFKVYETAEGAVQSARLVDNGGSGHGALAVLLRDLGVETLICGGIGAGARTALDQCGIQVLGGVTGEADAAMAAYLSGALAYDPAAQCTSHDHGGEAHDCGGSCHR